MQHTNSQNGHQPTVDEVTSEALRQHRELTPGFKKLLLVLGAVFLVGVVAFIIKAIDSFDDRSKWGYYAATFAFLFTAAQSAPMMAIAPRLVKASWSKPMARVAEMFAVVGLFNLLLFIPLLFLLPSGRGRFTLWFVDGWHKGWPPGAPHIWVLLAMIALVVCGLALLYVSSIPDLAAVRDHSTGRRRSLYSKLARNWRGGKNQWFTLNSRIGILGAFYFMMLITVHTLISLDFSMSLVPGWKDALYPAFHALNGLQAAIAIVLVAMFLLRQFGGLKDQLGVDQFWAPAKLLLAISLLWAYFWWSSFFVFWYGRSPAEQNVLKFLMFESYRTPWVLSFILTFVVPLVFLIWNRIRKSILGPTLVGVSVLVGTFLHRVTGYVSAFSIKDVSAHVLEEVPPAVLPGALDVLVLIGAISGAALVYLLGTKLFPVVSVWQLKEFMLFRRHRQFKRTEVMVLAKPE